MKCVLINAVEYVKYQLKLYLTVMEPVEYQMKELWTLRLLQNIADSLYCEYYEYEFNFENITRKRNLFPLIHDLYLTLIIIFINRFKNLIGISFVYYKCIRYLRIILQKKFINISSSN